MVWLVFDGGKKGGQKLKRWNKISHFSGTFHRRERILEWTFWRPGSTTIATETQKVGPLLTPIPKIVIDFPPFSHLPKDDNLQYFQQFFVEKLENFAFNGNNLYFWAVRVNFSWWLLDDKNILAPLFIYFSLSTTAFQAF